MAIILILIAFFSVASASQYYCDSEKYPLVSDLSESDCDNENHYYYTENGINDCFPVCQERNDLTSGVSCEVIPCPPGYYCADATSSAVATCKVNTTSCHRHYVAASNKYTKAIYKPTCLLDGSWAPKQCKGEPANGRCFCFDAAGNRIFGEEFSYKADDMTCACSRRRSEMESSGNYFFVSLHCDNMGNYEPLQCDIETEQCWCVEPKTGDLTSGIVPLGFMSKLSCYNETTVGTQYLRQCESQLYAQKKITEEFVAHGTLKVNFQTLACQYDGSYGPYTLSSSAIAYCVWKDNSNLGSYSATVTSSTVSSMTCNCARDAQIFADAGLSHRLTCEPDGSYQELQIDDDEYFCVDADGIIKLHPQAKEPGCESIVQ